MRLDTGKLIRHLSAFTFRTLSFLVKAVLVTAWTIWGLLGALPGGSLIKAALSITLLYSTGIVHIIAMLIGFDMAPIDTAIGGVSGLPDAIKGWFS